MKRFGLALTLTLFLAMVFSGSAVFGQEGKSAAVAAPEAATPADAAEKEDAVGPKDMSIYGEVQAVNAQANSLTVQYYNYDSDEEKTMDVVADKDTKMENAMALGEIKKGDWVDVMYVVSGGKNLAKSIVVEKEEMPAMEEAPAASSSSTAPAGD